MAFVDLLGFAGETLEVNIIAVIKLSYFIAFAKSLTSPLLGMNKKIAASAMASGHRSGDFWLDAVVRIRCFLVAEICHARSIFRRRLRCPLLLPSYRRL